MNKANVKVKDVIKWVKESVKWLVEEDCGLSKWELDDRIAILVGWMPGYDPEDPDDPGYIHSKYEPSWCLNIGLGVYTSDYMQTDMEYLNQPYFKDGDVWDTQLSLYQSGIDASDVKYLLDEYEQMTKYEINRDGLIEHTKLFRELDEDIEAVWFEGTEKEDYEIMQTKIEEAKDELFKEEYDELTDRLKKLFAEFIERLNENEANSDDDE